MRMKAIHISLFLVLCMASITFGNYQAVGQVSQDFLFDANDFSATDTTTQTTGIKELNKNSSFPTFYPPLVYDLNQDGRPEIVVVDAYNIQVLNNHTLDTADATPHNMFLPISNPLIFDIDGDSTKEIILAGRDKEIKIWNFSNQTLALENTLTWVNAAYSGGSLLIRCRASDQCILISQDADGRPSTDLFVHTFSSSNGTQGRHRLEDTTSTNQFNCFSQAPRIMLGNMDNEGSDEYIFTSTIVDITDNEENRLYYITVNNTDPTDISSFDVRVKRREISNAQNCRDTGVYNTLSNPLVYDFSSSNGDIDDIAVAYMDSASEVRLKTFNQGGTVVNTYGDGAYSWQGSTISQPIPLVYNFDTANTDICFLSNVPGSAHYIYCTAKEGGLFGYDQETAFSFYTDWNLTGFYGSYNSLIHSGDANDGTIIPEILTPFGVVDIPDVREDVCQQGGIGGFTLNNLCASSLFYETPKINGTAIISSINDAPGDLLIRQQHTLWYIDDDFVNTPGQVSEVSFNPCILDDIVQVNSTVKVTVTVDDVDGDAVNSRAIFYNGESYNQTYNWTSTNRTAGTPQTFSFTADVIQNNAELFVCGRDVENPGVSDCKTYQFSVSAEGVVYGDTVCTEDYDVGPAPEPGEEPLNVEDVPGLLLPEDAVPPGFYPLLALLIVVLTGVGAAIATSTAGIGDGHVVSLVGGLAAVAAWIAVIYMGMIGGWTLLVAIVLASAAVAVGWFSRVAS